MIERSKTVSSPPSPIRRRRSSRLLLIENRVCPPLPIAVEIGKARGVPVMVDAAYEIPPKENLWYHTKEVGVDAAIFSGGKALRGPSSTGLIVGRKEIVVS